MTIQLGEVGRKVSGANEQKLRAAVAALSAVLNQLTVADAGDGETGTAKEAAAPPKVQSLDDVRKSLQDLIDLLPPAAKEQLEGDGDFDNDPDNVRVQSRVGESLREGFPAGTKAPPFGNSIAKDTKCPKCGNIVKAGVAKCPKDGTPMVGTPPKGGPPTKESEYALLGDCIPLTEKSLRRDGTHPVKIIQPGWGSSGYYSEAVLSRDGPKVFPKGTKMFWDHPTKSEESDRPERSLRDLAAVLVSDARWESSGQDGPGLYADAQPLGKYAESVEQLAPHIGVSIRAHGKANQGEAEGKKGQIITEMVKGESIDYVTSPGAGGKILALFESAGRGNNKEDKVSEAELREARTKLSEAEQERDRLREALLLREARDIVVDALSKVEGIPAPTIRRLTESLAKDPPTDDGKLDKVAFGKLIKESIKAESEYLQSVLGTGTVKGLGGEGLFTGGEQVTTEKFHKGLEESFKMLGLSESTAKLAATGRG